MPDQFSRTELLLGPVAMKKLAASRVAVFGIGGVGGYAVEALARSGIGHLDLIDDDKVCLSNLNRQLHATHNTLGQYKVEVAEARIREINPEAKVTSHRCFFMPETADQFDFTCYDYVVDAIDTVTAKLELVKRAKAAGVPIIASMGAGNKLDPTAFRVADISKTKVCPLAKVIRKELRKLGIKKLKVVYSEEIPLKVSADMPDRGPENPAAPAESRRDAVRRGVPGSIAFVPSVVGLIIAGEVIKDLIKNS